MKISFVKASEIWGFAIFHSLVGGLNYDSLEVAHPADIIVNFRSVKLHEFLNTQFKFFTKTCNINELNLIEESNDSTSIKSNNVVNLLNFSRINLNLVKQCKQNNTKFWNTVYQN